MVLCCLAGSEAVKPAGGYDFPPDFDLATDFDFEPEPDDGSCAHANRVGKTRYDLGARFSRCKDCGAYFVYPLVG